MPRLACLPPLVDAAVLGAGPAGVAAAVGLKRLGYTVAVVGSERRAVIEGLSPSAVARLKSAQLPCAAAYAAISSPRVAVWAGLGTARGTEFLVDREAFDRALARDLTAAGVPLAGQSVIAVTADSPGWRITTSAGIVRSRAVLEARGRRARRDDQRGPRLVAWSEIYRSAGHLARGSAVVALDDGWVWLASDGDGLLQRQFVGSVRQRLSPAQLRLRFAAAADALPQLDFAPRGACLMGRTQARAAVARYCRPAQAPGLIRIGDAAVAMDPLSGQGIYEALGSAHVAVAALNTYFGGADWAPLARFVDERCAEIWRRSLATAGSFYRLQSDHIGSTPHLPARRDTGAAFWEESARAYERLAAAAALRDQEPGRFELRPVLNGARIEMRPVWVDSRRPRGVWTINGSQLTGARAANAPAALTQEV